ncbi:IS1 family transposase, partial [Halomicronema sp. CCY15110]|uniref:IS1 family transposase n=1 Tax=Halomicronema sp. CCY15110 TaxID=2767773 RepID=UPI002107208A
MVVQVEAAEMNEMWSFVQSKRQQRWLWHAIDHRTGDVLAYVLAPHEDQAIEILMALLTPFGIQQFYAESALKSRGGSLQSHQTSATTETCLEVWRTLMGYGTDSCKNGPHLLKQLYIKCFKLR